MAVIFTASSDSHSYQHSSTLFEPLIRWLFPHMSPAGVQEMHHLFRKCCHLTEYSCLALLLWRAFRLSTGNRFGGWYWPEAGLALLVVFLYAATDEYHQSFVPGRTALFSDVLIDTAGGALALLLLWFIRFASPQIQRS